MSRSTKATAYGLSAGASAKAENPTYCMPEAKNNYELGFHLTPNIEELQVAQLQQEVEKILTANGAVIIYSKEPEKTRLSYSIKHEQASYFGYIHFNLPDREMLNSINEQLRLNNQILRYIILVLVPESKRQKGKPRSLMGQGQEHKAKKPEQATTEEEKKKIEKQLEEIIEGL
ncbi:MAG TPA: 30S ribosomal protein S6 [Candidatus Paceibacterota bacterium]|nr:30S ribosomal protein S6 [Candidatus Paceibacterota bacterium]